MEDLVWSGHDSRDNDASERWQAYGKLSGYGGSAGRPSSPEQNKHPFSHPTAPLQCTGCSCLVVGGKEFGS